MKKMNSILVLLAVSLLMASPLAHAAPNATSAKPANQRFRIMMILYRGLTEAERGFMNYFAERKIPVEFIIRDAQEDKLLLPGFVKEIRNIKPDLVYTFGTSVTTAIIGPLSKADAGQDFIRDIPVVFNIVADPVGAKITADLKSSGRNVTGVSHIVPLQSQLKAMTSIAKFNRLGVVYNPQEQNSQLTVNALSGLAKEFQFSLEAVPVKPGAAGKPDTDTLNAAMKSLIAKSPDAIYLPSDSFIIGNAYEATSQGSNAKIPVFSATEDPIRKYGALAGLVCTYYNVGKFAGYKAEEILVNGKQPKDIPMETLNRFTFLVNMRTAKALNIYPSVSVLQAAEVIRD